MGRVPAEQLGEVLLRDCDDLLEGVEELLGGELHDLSVEVDYPDQLLALGQHFLAEVQQPLTGVVHQLVVLEHLRQLVHLDVADAVDHYRVPVLVFAADRVLVHLLDLLDPPRVEVVLSERRSTRYWCLNCRKAGSSWLRLARPKR